MARWFDVVVKVHNDGDIRFELRVGPVVVPEHSYAKTRSRWCGVVVWRVHNDYVLRIESRVGLIVVPEHSFEYEIALVWRRGGESTLYKDQV